MNIRIGINVGDLIVEGEDLFGDGVNVAARLEGLAEPGGICVSESAHEQVHRKLDLTFEDLGERSVKNIDEPVRVYGVILEQGRSTAPSAPAARQKRVVLVAALAVLAILIAGGLFLWTDRGGDAPARVVAESRESVANEVKATALPSIAVLAFQNMSNDPEQEYFADGMAEDIITDLSKLSALFVVARNSSFQYKGQAVDVKQVGRALGVEYILEGSVRRAGDQLRISAQLIEVETGGHLWAERYDGALADVFALQDKVTGQIIAALSLQLGAGEIAELADHGTNNIEAHDAFLKGQSYASKYTADDAKRAIAFYKRALELDPNYQRAKEALAQIRQIEKFNGFQ
jgi:TolB-like protein